MERLTACRWGIMSRTAGTAEQHDAHVRTYHAHMQWQRIRSRHRRYKRANYIGLNPW